MQLHKQGYITARELRANVASVSLSSLHAKDNLQMCTMMSSDMTPPEFVSDRGDATLGPTSGHENALIRATRSIVITPDGCTNVCIDILCDRLHVEWNPETVVEIEKYARSLSSPSSAVEPLPDDSDLDVVATPSSNASTGTKLPGKTLRINASLQQASICLNKEIQRRRIALISVTNMVCSLLSCRLHC